MASTTLKVSITGDASGLQKAARSAETSVSSMSAKIDKAQGSFKSGFVGSGTSAEEWGKRVHLASGVAAAGAAYFAKKAGDMASDVAEAQNKVGVVFEGSADEVTKFAQTSAKAYGISKAAALDYTGTLGNLLVSSGLSSKAAADMSVSMVKLAADLGSFNNVPVDDALEAIRSGLVGESEPLKRFGVNLNEATLKAKAMQLGLSDGKGTLDANAKAQAAYAIILAQTGTAQGDFARTSTGLANSQKIASATAQDAAASMGTSFLPVYKEAVRVVSAGVQVFDKLPSGLKTGAVAFTALGGAALFLAPKVVEGAKAIQSVVKAVGNLTHAQRDLAAADAVGSTANAGVASSLTKTAAAATVVLAPLAAVMAIHQAGAKAGKEYAAALVEGEAPLKALATLQAEALKPGQSLENLTGINAQMDAQARLLLTTGSSTDILKAVQQNLLNGIPKWKAYAAANLSAANAIVQAGQSQKAANEAVREGTATVEQAHRVNKQRLTNTLDQIEKNTALRASLRDLTESVKAYKENEADAAGQGPRSAAIRQQAAEQAVANAESIRQAEQAQVDAERGLQSSIRGVADAEHARAEAGRAVVAAQRGVEAAERGVTDAVRNQQAAVRAVGEAEHSRLEALRSVESAERSLQSAERASAASVRDLTQARKDAAYQLASAALGARGDALSVQAAQFALDDARRAAAAGPGADNTDPNAQGKLNLAVSQAQLQLESATASAAKSQEDLTDAQKKGVEGSDRVVAAQQAISDSALAVSDAHHGVTEAQRGVTTADQALVDAHRGVDTANQGVKDSLVNLEGAHHDLKEAMRGVADADRGIRDAHYEVAKAQDAVTEAAKNTSIAVQKQKDDYQIAQFEIALVMNDAKTNSGLLKDAIEKDMAAAATAASNLALPLAIIDALLSHITGGTPIDLSGFQAVTAASTYGTSGGGTSARAKGGPVSKGKAYLVGEQGPETFVPDANGTIVPHARKGEVGNKADDNIDNAAKTLDKASIAFLKASVGATTEQKKIILGLARDIEAAKAAGATNIQAQKAADGTFSITSTPKPVEITSYDPSKLGPQIATSGKYKGIDLNPASHFGAPTGALTYTSPAEQAAIDMKASIDALVAQLSTQTSVPLQVTVVSKIDGSVVAQSTGAALATTAVSQGGRRPH